MGYEPRAGDIVIASKTTAEPLGEAVVKRAVALAGQTVELDYGEGRVLVDRQALAEPYLLEPMALPQKPEMQGTRFQVEADSLFLLGTTATAPPTAGTAGWAACTGTACWAGRWR